LYFYHLIESLAMKRTHAQWTFSTALLLLLLSLSQTFAQTLHTWEVYTLKFHSGRAMENPYALIPENSVYCSGNVSGDAGLQGLGFIFFCGLIIANTNNSGPLKFIQ